MAEALLSVGLDVGTSTTQLIVSRLLIENKASSFSVPEMQITQREILYKSPVYFTPLLSENLVDGEKIRTIVEQEYSAAGISRAQVDSGAIIVTGETSRKENARAVADGLSAFAGDFVVATAGPHLESVLAAKGAGADRYSEETGKTVLHMDIGGGTTNLALIQNGKILSTGCVNVGGRLLKFDKDGRIIYRSGVLERFPEFKQHCCPTVQQLQQLCQKMAQALEMAAGYRPATELLGQFWTREAGNPWLPPKGVDAISFSGGVSECMEHSYEPFVFGDIGPLLGQALRESLLCRDPFRLGADAIRATVIGAGCHSAQLSGSTIFYRNITFPLKNLPVVTSLPALSQLDGPGILAISDSSAVCYRQISALADEIAQNWPSGPVLVALQADMAKALGHALALRLPEGRSILCIDRVKLSEESYLDVGHPVNEALPVVIKTLIWSNHQSIL